MTSSMKKVSFFGFGTGKFTLRIAGVGGRAVIGAKRGPVDSPPALKWR